MLESVLAFSLPTPSATLPSFVPNLRARRSLLIEPATDGTNTRSGLLPSQLTIPKTKNRALAVRCLGVARLASASFAYPDPLRLAV